MVKFRIIVTAKAHEDIADCVSFVLNASQEAALALSSTIYSSLESLSDFPERNPIFEMPKQFPFLIRKQIIDKRYIALYSTEEEKVVIYRFIDTRKKFDYLLLR